MRVQITEGRIVLDAADVLHALADRSAPAHRDTLIAIAGTTDMELTIPVSVKIGHVWIALGSSEHIRAAPEEQGVGSLRDLALHRAAVRAGARALADAVAQGGRTIEEWPPDEIAELVIAEGVAEVERSDVETNVKRDGET